MKILLIDNYDSFTQNIAQYLYEVTGSVPSVVTNSLTYEELTIDEYDAVVLSPGPGHPAESSDFGVCAEVIAHAKVPLLGICLGHQGINLAFGGVVEHAPNPVHGYRSRIRNTGEGLFLGLPEQFEVVRYHSLVCTRLPDNLKCTAWTDDGLIMAIEHTERPIWGVQFHPESIDSEYGRELLSNFVRIAETYKENNEQEVTAQNICTDINEAYLAVGGRQDLNLNYRECKEIVDPESLFIQRYGNDTHAFWLDSENSDRPNARFSMMGSGNEQGAVRLEYSVQTENLRLIGPDGERIVQGDFFSLMSQLLDVVAISTPKSMPLVFKGGFVGYLGYELKALTIGSNKYRSEHPDASLIFTPHFFVFDHQQSKLYECFITPIGQPHHWSPELFVTNTKNTDEVIPDFIPGAVDQNKICLEYGAEKYMDGIHKSLQYITDGESYEICLTNRAKMTYSGHPLDAYRRMRHASPVPYGAYLACGNFSVLSASPETFLRIDDARNIESRPIKGTRPRGKTAADDQHLQMELSQSTKDRAENLMIVDLVRHDLNQVCRPGSVHVPELFKVESFSSVHQLVSTIRGQLCEETSSIEAIRACFPGGSMTGAPKKRTMEIIDALESSARGVYSGALGWLSFSGEVELSIVIRTAVLHQECAEFGIGGAIVAHSDPYGEFEETLVKASVPYFSFSHMAEEVCE
ncbi:aminodeoxychorismate synthase component I [Photorhabdus laumondii]|uniref:aminodeoxychorismate synthase n=1 Tax=Photorhabdus laumondii subsp. clarkei TaxID=2029685 RepID=A0A329VK16_9GAMM|nr:aminodeoxychorismate synthase component I [Photorhabdus laumondii]RAW92129.1 aminodeoxychorismate synthase, component I [Photorhabdus laumondii subsp. clarkei]